MLLRREGWQVNAKRIDRLHTEEGLQLRHKPPKRRVVSIPKEISPVVEVGGEPVQSSYYDLY